MYICVKCKREMRCQQNGVQVCYAHGTHNYAGDSFKCPGCGTVIIASNTTASHYDRYRARPGDVIMDNWDGNPKKQIINLRRTHEQSEQEPRGYDAATGELAAKIFRDGSIVY